jgi:hypothetical protein
MKPDFVSDCLGVMEVDVKKMNVYENGCAFGIADNGFNASACC